MAEKNLERLLGVLKSSGADAWEVADVNEKGWEFYFIRHQLDQHRAKSVDSFSVKVYKNLEGGTLLGSASAPEDLRMPSSCSRCLSAILSQPHFRFQIRAALGCFDPFLMALAAVAGAVRFPV